jgi:hypothetical protein
MATKKDLLVGQLALERDYITEEQLAEALKRQSDLFEAGTQAELLDIFVSQGHVTAVQAVKIDEAVASSLTSASEASSGRPKEKARAQLARSQSKKGTRSRPPVRPGTAARSPVRHGTAARARIRGEAEGGAAPPKKANVGLILGIAVGSVLMMAAVVWFFTSESDDPWAMKEEPEPPPVSTRASTSARSAPREGRNGAAPTKFARDLVPPGDAERNVLPNGSLEDMTGGRFKYWRLRNGSVRMKRDDSNEFDVKGWCEFPEGSGYLEQELVLDREWAELRVSAVMACNGLEFGEGPDDTFRVAIHFEDKDGNHVGVPDKVPELIEDTDWVDVSATFSVPPDAQAMVLRLGNFGAAGDCRIDEIRVIPEKLRRPVRVAAPEPREEPEEPAIEDLLGDEPEESPPPADEVGAAGGEEERDAILAEFREFVTQGDNPAAEALANKSAKDPKLAPYAEQFAAAVGVARALEKRRSYVRQTVNAMVDLEKEFRTVKGPQTGKVAGASEDGIDLSRDIVKNRKVLGQRTVLVPWSDLTREQMDELAEGWRPDDADGHVAIAVLAAGRGEKGLEALAEALDAAGDHPLVDWVIGLTE